MIAAIAPQPVAFTLPQGFLDGQGQLQTQGSMRPTTGADEFWLQEQPQFLAEPDYGWFLLWSRVVIQLGPERSPTPRLWENLFLNDLFYLQDFYRQINRWENLGAVGEGPHYPLDLLYGEISAIAFYFHWPLGDILQLTHWQRRRWLQEVELLLDQ